MADGQVIFEITADGKHAIASVKDVTSAIQTESGKWDKAVGTSTSGMENSFLGAAKKIATGIGAMQIAKTILEWGSAAVQAASDLEEVQNVVDVTFGTSAGKIESWAKRASSQFGLTETQAKKFASTLGSMMKSAGVSGDEIYDMSTSLSELAADMASFYNLDFETAFQKLRAGISGETEPLKQLGVNMSVANLEAYALSQGITTAYNSMSQGEQTLLRYKYLMSATADAQGDFARTSDSFSNAQRRIQTSIESIKTSFGTALLTVIGDATDAVAGFLEQLTASPEETIIDKLNAIDVETDQKLADIRTVSDKAKGLIDKLNAISGTSAGEALEKLASGANKLDASSPGTWSSILTSLEGVDGLQNIFSNTQAAGNVTSLADALSNATIDQSKVNAWDSFLSTLSDNAGALAEYTGQSEGDVRTWIGDIAQRAKELDPSDVTAWDSLFGDLTSKLGITADDVENITGIKTGANALKTNSVNNWNNLFAVLGNIDGLQNVFGNSSASSNITDLASALSGASVDTDKATAWKTFLGALSDNADAVSKLTGSSVEETKKWLDGLADSIDKIDPNDADAWDRLLNTLASGLGGGSESQGFIEGMTGQLLSLGKNSETAKTGLEALGYSSDQITQKQEAWLSTCKDLVKTIPGLSEIINTETGEVNGGIGALNDYVEEWKASQEKLARWKAYYQKEDALRETQNNLITLEIEAGGADKAVQRAKKAIEGYAESLGIDLDYYGENLDWSKFRDQRNVLTEEQRAYNDSVDEYNRLLGVSSTAHQKYEQAVEDSVQATQMLADQREYLVETDGDVTRAEIETGEAIQDTGEYLGQNTQYWTDTTAAVNEAVTALADYVKGVHDATESSVNSTLDGFSHVKTAAQAYEDAANELKDYREELEKSGNYTETEIEIKVNAKNAQVTLQGLTDNIKSQIAYIQEYKQNLQRAQELGVSDEILAQLSDGSEESAQRLHAIVEAYQDWEGGDIPEDIKALNEAYETLNGEKEGFVDTLTQQKLTVDETYAAMLQTAQETIAQMNLSTEAAEASGNTVAGLATGISNHVSDVSSAVDSILTELNRLSGWGISIDLGTFGSFGFKLDGSHERGLDYVPFSGYLAELHEGEGILTAEENRIWQRFKNGDTSSRNVDYDALGGVMRDNVKAGGNVYLEGRVVGQVVSQIQGNSYRSLQRSGWQA